MVKVTLDLNKSIEENAGVYYDQVKKLRKKLEGAKLALERARLEEAKILKKEEAELARREEPKEKEKKEWFEKFRWFYSSEGFLCIGGRDATTNEIVVKKHTLKDDLVFHTDMAGSPFFVIKTEGKVPDATIREVADATATFSRAWKLGLSSSSVFYVKPEQVTKEAQSGEYIQKGSFMVRGKTTYVENSLNLAMGVYEGKVMAGPLEAVQKHCKEYIIIGQGSEKASAIGKLMKKEFKIEPDDVIRALPSGSFRIEKIVKEKKK